MRGDYTAVAGCHRHSKCSESKRGVAFYSQQIPPSGGLSTLATSVTVTGSNVAQIAATKDLYATEQRQQGWTAAVKCIEASIFDIYISHYPHQKQTNANRDRGFPNIRHAISVK